MSQIPPIDDNYIDEVIRSAGPYNQAIHKTQGVKLRELIKKLRDYFEQETKQGVNEQNFANIADRDAYNVSVLPFQAFIADDGNGKWALYRATSTGVGANYIKISDPDLLNAVMNSAAIKVAYESNTDTNAFTDAEKSKLENLGVGTLIPKASNGLHVDSSTGQVQLGGVLLNSTTIDTGNKSLLILNNSTYQGGGLTISPDSVKIVLNEVQGVSVISDEVAMYYSADNRLSVNSEEVVISTNQTQRGARYAADYSANFTDLSLINKKWALDTFATMPDDVNVPKAVSIIFRNLSGESLNSLNGNLITSRGGSSNLNDFITTEGINLYSILPPAKVSIAAWGIFEPQNISAVEFKIYYDDIYSHTSILSKSDSLLVDVSNTEKNNANVRLDITKINHIN